MKIGVVSDIHGNMEALEAVCTDMAAFPVDCVISLGDNIGYGPEPEAVVQRLRALSIPSVLGNHEFAVLHPRHIDNFNPYARISILKTMEMLSESTVSDLTSLPLYIPAHHCRFVHGAPPDSPLLYMYECLGVDGKQIFSLFPEPVCFLGHTHRLDLYSFDGKTVWHPVLKEGKIRLAKNCRHVINAGSVGQPRDGDNRAKYVIWEPEQFILQVRCVPYDIGAVAKKIIAAGLPRNNADRLW